MGVFIDIFISFFLFVKSIELVCQKSVLVVEKRKLKLDIIKILEEYQLEDSILGMLEDNSFFSGFKVVMYLQDDLLNNDIVIFMLISLGIELIYEIFGC